jgi:hypothetical protein
MVLQARAPSINTYISVMRCGKFLALLVAIVTASLVNAKLENAIENPTEIHLEEYNQKQFLH